MKKMNVQGFEISIVSENESDYISLTDMLRAKDGEFAIIKSQAGSKTANKNVQKLFGT